MNCELAMTETPKPPRSQAYEQFLKSMKIDYEAWHDGTGYDLESLGKIGGAEREEVEGILIERMRRAADWRDIEALAALKTRGAVLTLQAACKSGDAGVRVRAAEALAGLGEEIDLDAYIIDGLNEGMSGSAGYAIDLAQKHPTPRIRKALLGAALDGKDSTVRVNAAAMCMFLAGKADEPFDWNHRPFFLRFGAEDHAARLAAYKELAAIVGETELGKDDAGKSR
jgi:hypothetical protein